MLIFKQFDWTQEKFAPIRELQTCGIFFRIGSRFLKMSTNQPKLIRRYHFTDDHKNGDQKQIANYKYFIFLIKTFSISGN